MTLNGNKHIYNFDETSFTDLTGSRTIAQKRTVKKSDHQSLQPHQKTNQPNVKNYVGSNQRVSIGCTITASGEKLKPIINVKGCLSKCMTKFYCPSIKNCCVTYTKSSWFHEETMFKVLYMIRQHSHGIKSLCLWDSYKPHLSKISKIITTLADQLNIELLMVPKGLTYKYQPLDVKFNGIFKSLMKTYWLKHQFNEDKDQTCQHMIETYYSIKPPIIISSFECINY
jgi:hypothetical protein